MKLPNTTFCTHQSLKVFSFKVPLLPWQQVTGENGGPKTPRWACTDTSPHSRQGLLKRSAGGGGVLCSGAPDSNFPPSFLPSRAWSSVAMLPPPGSHAAPPSPSRVTVPLCGNCCLCVTQPLPHQGARGQQQSPVHPQRLGGNDKHRLD